MEGGLGEELAVVRGSGKGMWDGGEGGDGAPTPWENDRAVGAGVAGAASAALPAEPSPPGSAFASPGSGSGAAAVEQPPRWS